MEPALLFADVLWLLISALLLGTAAVKMERTIASEEGLVHLQLLTWAVGPGASLALVALILARPSSYLRYRTAIGTALKVARSSLTAIVWVSCKHLVSPSPRLGWRVLLAKGLLLLVSGLGFQMPMRVHLWVQGFMLATFLATTGWRCAHECSAPGVAAFYRRLSLRIGAAAARLLPITVASRHDVRFRGLPSSGPCVLISAWALVAVGFLLPTLVLSLARSRAWDWEGSQGWLRPQPALLLLNHLGLLALGTVAGWTGLELALHVLQQWGILRFGLQGPMTDHHL